MTMRTTTTLKFVLEQVAGCLTIAALVGFSWWILPGPHGARFWWGVAGVFLGLPLLAYVAFMVALGIALTRQGRATRREFEREKKGES